MVVSLAGVMWPGPPCQHALSVVHHGHNTAESRGVAAADCSSLHPASTAAAAAAASAALLASNNLHPTVHHHHNNPQGKDI